MPDRARFVLVTDDIEFALADVFASARSNAPSWVRVVDDPVEILALPSGCKVHFAIWCSTRQRSGAEIAWHERRQRGDLVFLTDGEMEKIAVWRTRRARGETAVIEQKAGSLDLPAPSPPAVSLPIQQWT